MAYPTRRPNHTQSNHNSSSIFVRSATHHDLHFLPAIFNHYITQTVISFRLKPVDIGFFETIWEDTRNSGLPFFISCIRTPAEHKEADVEEETVIGYAYALPFRSSYPAYRYTVEISIFIHPEYHSQGGGSALMDALLGALRTARVLDPTLPLDRGDVVEEVDGPGRVRQVLSVMSLDPKGRDDGHGLENFYARWGFERTGYLKKVGYKFGMWIDVIFLQVTL